MQEELIDAVLVSLRRIIRATSLHSRKLGKDTGLTTAQLVVLREVEGAPAISVSDIARHISLSQATVTTLIQHLEAQELVSKQKSETDKRRLEVTLTSKGADLLASAPPPLQEDFAERFEQLESWEQYAIVSALERVAVMMDATNLDAAPLLAGGDITEESVPASDSVADPQDQARLD